MILESHSCLISLSGQNQITKNIGKKLLNGLIVAMLFRSLHQLLIQPLPISLGHGHATQLVENWYSKSRYYFWKSYQNPLMQRGLTAMHYHMSQSPRMAIKYQSGGFVRNSKCNKAKHAETKSYAPSSLHFLFWCLRR